MDSEWKLPLGCLAFGALALRVALVMSQSAEEATDVLWTWKRIGGVVIQTDRLERTDSNGHVTYSDRETVRFTGPDGKWKEGFLFDEAIPQGSRITVFYDPQKDYSPGGPIYNGAREMKSPQDIQRETGLDKFAIGLSVFFVGIALCAFGSYRVLHLVRHGKPAGQTG